MLHFMQNRVNSQGCPSEVGTSVQIMLLTRLEPFDLLQREVLGVKIILYITAILPGQYGCYHKYH